MKLSFRFKHDSSTPFETIKRGTAELGSATAVARLAFKRRAIVVPNSIHKSTICIYYALFVSITYGATVLGSTFETAAVLSSCHSFEFGTAVARRLEQA